MLIKRLIWDLILIIFSIKYFKILSTNNCLNNKYRLKPLYDYYVYKK